MKSGCDAFIIFQKKILLILRDNDPTIEHPNLWNLPGGGSEAGETAQETIQRELQEEIGLVSQELEYLDQTTYSDGNVVSKFWARIDEREKEQLVLGEGQRMEFFLLDEVLQLPIIPNLRTYLEQNLEKIKELTR